MESARAVGVRLRAGRACSTCRAGCRRRSRPTSREAVARQVQRDSAAHPGPRVRAVHQLRDDARGLRSGDGGAAAIRCWCRGRRREARLLNAVPHAPRMPCCSATSSFWQGVDVVGEQLSCVMIDKLPFASPGDPDHRGADRGDQPPTAATRSTTTRCRWRFWRCCRGWAG